MRLENSSQYSMNQPSAYISRAHAFHRKTQHGIARLRLKVFAFPEVIAPLPTPLPRYAPVIPVLAAAIVGS